MIWTSDQIKRIWMKNMRTVYNNKKNILILIKKFHQDHSLWFVLIEWIKEENWWLLSDIWITKWITKSEKSWIRTWFWLWSKIIITNTNTNWLHAHEIWKFWNLWCSRSTVTELHSLAAWKSWWNFQLISWSWLRTIKLIQLNNMNLKRHFSN